MTGVCGVCDYFFHPLPDCGGVQVLESGLRHTDDPLGFPHSPLKPSFVWFEFLLFEVSHNVYTVLCVLLIQGQAVGLV